MNITWNNASSCLKLSNVNNIMNCHLLFVHSLIFKRLIMHLLWRPRFFFRLKSFFLTSSCLLIVNIVHSSCQLCLTLKASKIPALSLRQSMTTITRLYHLEFENTASQFSRMMKNAENASSVLKSHLKHDLWRVIFFKSIISSRITVYAVSTHFRNSQISFNEFSQSWFSFK